MEKNNSIKKKKRQAEPELFENNQTALRYNPKEKKKTPVG